VSPTVDAGALARDMLLAEGNQDEPIAVEAVHFSCRHNASVARRNRLWQSIILLRSKYNF